MAIDYASIGLRLKHARIKMEMSQEQLAEVLNISRTQIGYLETGKRGISLELLVDASNALETPVSELLADSLTTRDIEKDSELYYILLDCTKDEERIVTKNAQRLIEILRENGI